jgi:hypothetical protein
MRSRTGACGWCSRFAGSSGSGPARWPQWRTGAVAAVAAKLGINRETLRGWVRRAEVDSGPAPGTSTVDGQRLAELERENRGTEACQRDSQGGGKFLRA